MHLNSLNPDTGRADTQCMRDVPAVPDYLEEMGTAGSDELSVALMQLIEALQANAERTDSAITRATAMAAKVGQQGPVEEVLAADGATVLEAVNKNLSALVLAGGRLRRAQARALHNQGVTMDRIAEIFGVSRQRISMLIRDTDMQGPPWATRRATPY